MNTKKKPEIDKDKMGPNPFIANILIKARLIDKDEYAVFEKSEDILIPAGSIKSKMLVEEQKYTKVWHDVEYRDIVLGLSYDALKLHTYILYKIESNVDYIWINNRHFQNAVRMKHKKDYIAAVDELVRYGLLAKTIYEEVYWINSLIYFCGNRVGMYPKNVVLRQSSKSYLN